MFKYLSVILTLVDVACEQALHERTREGARSPFSSATPPDEELARRLSWGAM